MEGKHLKVVQVVNSLAIGGAEIFVAQLAGALSTRCTVQVWTYAGMLDAGGDAMRDQLEKLGVSVRSLNITRAGKKTMIPLLWRRWMQQEQPDVVNAHLDQSEFFIAAAALGKWKRPVLLRTVHNTRVIPPLRHVQRWVASRFDHTIACSDAVLSSPARALTPERSSMVPCGIVVPPIPDAFRRDQLRRKLLLSENKVVMLCIGTMNLRCGELAKGQDQILREFAAARLASRSFLVFLGDGAQRPALEELAAELGVSSSVRFCGLAQPERKWDYIMACDCGLILSRFEGLPLVGMEFGCAGIPMLISDIAELKPFATRGSLVARNGAISEAMAEIVEGMPAISAEARAMAGYYRSRYTIEASADAYYQLYLNSLMANNRASANSIARQNAPRA